MTRDRAMRCLCWTASFLGALGFGLAVLRVGWPAELYAAMMTPAAIRWLWLSLDERHASEALWAQERLRRRAAEQVAYEVALDRERRRRGLEP